MEKYIAYDNKMNNKNVPDKYKFYSNKTEGLYNISNKTKTFVFYQFCLFINDKYERYNIRKIIYDNSFNILNVREFMIPKDDYIKLIEILPKHKYMTYSTFNLSTIDVPCEGELMMATSELLSNEINYYGYANIN